MAKYQPGMGFWPAHIPYGSITQMVRRQHGEPTSVTAYKDLRQALQDPRHRQPAPDFSGHRHRDHQAGDRPRSGTGSAIGCARRMNKFRARSPLSGIDPPTALVLHGRRYVDGLVQHGKALYGRRQLETPDANH
jgi:hypothetical protein